MSTLKEHQNYLLQLALALTEVNASNYLAEAMPSATDKTLMEMANIYLSVTSEERSLFSALVDNRTSSILGIFAHRMSMLAVRNRSDTHLLHGLIMLMLALPSQDWRETTMTLSLLYNSSKKLDKVRELFGQAASVAPTPSAASWLVQFSERAPMDQRIEAMGFKEIEGSQGLIYQFGQQKIPAGWM